MFLQLLQVQVQLVGDSLAAGGAVEAGVRRPVGEALHDVGQPGLVHRQVPLTGLSLGTELDVQPLQGQEWNVNVDQTGVNNRALMKPCKNVLTSF